jgi:hypothetical protein
MRLYIPMNKALVVMEKGYTLNCTKCAFNEIKNCHKKIACRGQKRKDGKNVLFRLVDLPEEKRG